MNRDRLLIFLLGLVLFFPFLGSVHLFDWDEINFAESAREMLITRDWWRVTINFEPFHEKPPLFFWLQVLSMSAFGVNEFAARFPNAVCGIVTLLVIYQVGKEWKDRVFGWTWVLLYVGSFLPHLYFKSGIIDPWFNLFIFLSVYFLFKTITLAGNRITRHAALAGVFTGLAVLTKGPVGFLLLLLTFLTWWVHHRFIKPGPVKAIAVFAVCAAGISSLWFGYETIRNGPWFLVEFINYQAELFLHPVAGHKQPFFYHFLVVLVGCFPMSVLAIPAFSKGFQKDNNDFSLWMKYLFWVVMILFSITTTKIVHYSSMTYLPLSYLASSIVYQHYHGRQTVKKWQHNWLLVHGLILAAVFIALPLALKFKSSWLDLVKDPFAKGNLLVDVPWHGWEFTIGLFFVICMLVFRRLSHTRPVRSFMILMLGTAITIFCLMAVIVPKIEGYSQRSAIEFFKAHASEHPVFETYGYKSYAQYFYGEVLPGNMADNNKVLVSCKLNKANLFMEENPAATELYRAGGFVFFEKAH